LVDYIDNFLNAVEYSDFRELVRFIRIVLEGRGLLPPETIECVTTTEEWGFLRLKYGINEHTRMPLYVAHAMGYTTRHWKEVRSEFKPISKEWDMKEYEKAGESFACLMHKVTDTKKEEISAEEKYKTILYRFLNGLFKENDLSSPKEVMNCFSEEISKDLVLYIGDFLDAVDFDNARDVIHFLRVMYDGRGVVPPETVECVTSTVEWGNLRLRYGINEHTKMHYYYAHVMGYTVTHLK